MIPSVLIIDDERVLAQAMHDYLGRHGYEPSIAYSGEEGLDAFKASEPDLVILDYRLPGADGLTVLRELKQLAPAVEVLLLTAHGSVKTAVDAMRAGAFDYLTKPVDLEELVVVLGRAWQHVCLAREVSYLRQSRGDVDPRERLVGDSEFTRDLRLRTQRLAAVDHGAQAAPAVLITGDTGTGKGLLARTIHDLSPRAARAFIEVNCAAIPATLLESEMFGYERGAFTEARTAKMGLVEAADGGTLFLDEIGAMSLELQVKILKVIEDKAVRRLGGTRTKSLDVRVIAATNSDLDDAIRQGTFRADLLYRLKVLTVHLPPLRERVDDVVPLARYFLGRFGGRYRRPRQLALDAEAALRRYAWPGNVRELSNVIERAVLLEEGRDIREAALGLAGPAPRGGAVEIDAGGVRVDLSMGGVRLAEIEQTLIVEALKTAGGNRRRAAELLDISFDTLRYRLEKYGLIARNET